MAKMDTDSTREFLELNSGRDAAWRSRYTGEDVIIGIIDSGLYPEHPSFADVETPSKGDRGRPIAYGPPPAHQQHNQRHKPAAAADRHHSIGQLERRQFG